jgi:hypothetical protein
LSHYNNTISHTQKIHAQRFEPTTSVLLLAKTLLLLAKENSRFNIRDASDDWDDFEQQELNESLDGFDDT